MPPDSKGVTQPLRGVREAANLWRIAGPLAVSFAIENIMAFTDAIIIGKLSITDLAAFGVASRLITNAIYIICLCVVGFVVVFASDAVGRGDQSGVGKALRHALWLGSLLSLPVMAMMFEMGVVLRIAGQPSSIVTAGQAYGRAAMGMVLPYVVFSVLRDFTAAVANVKSAIYVVGGASAANFLLSWTLVHGLFGIRGIGIAGAGFSASAVSWGMAMSEICVVWRLARAEGQFYLADFFSFDMAYLLRYLRLGLPLALNSVAQSALWISAMLLIGMFGTVALAANQVAFSFGPVVFVLAEGVREALGIQIARARVERRSALRRITLYGIGLLAAYLVPISIAMLVIPGTITSLFVVGDGAEAVRKLAADLLAILAINQITEGVQVALLGSLKGLQDTTVPFLLALVGYWAVGVPLGYYLAFCASWGPVGLWVGLSVGIVAATLLLALRYLAITRPSQLGCRPDVAGAI
jgi:multidrug resistance protein, MATE family